MTDLTQAVGRVLATQRDSRKPLAIVLAGHNGSGKSTLWRRSLADRLQIPLINADRMMLSILPEPDNEGRLVAWAQALRDTDRSWMAVAQQGVNAFVGQAMGAKVPFAMETVFSHWAPQPDGSVRSKIDLVGDMQEAGYFVLLLFVGLSSADLSILRVETRIRQGGHAVETDTLRRRFPRTQTAIGAAVPVANACIMVDNSRTEREAFTVARVQIGRDALFDLRSTPNPPRVVTTWLDRVAPLS